MRPFIDFTQAGSCDMRINLRGHEAFVSEQFLNAADVGAAIQKMRGKTVAERMRTSPSVQPCCGEVFFQHAPNTSRGEAAAEPIYENGRRCFFGLL